MYVLSSPHFYSHVELFSILFSLFVKMNVADIFSSSSSLPGYLYPDIVSFLYTNCTFALNAKRYTNLKKKKARARLISSLLRQWPALELALTRLRTIFVC